MGSPPPKNGDNALTPSLLLDTHVLVRWLADSRKLSREQLRVIRGAVRRCEPLALSAITLFEIAVLFGEGSGRSRVSARELLAALGPGSGFHVVSIDLEIAAEIAAMGDSLRDPADRAIVAAARIHRLRLVTSDQRIVESKLVPVIE